MGLDWRDEALLLPSLPSPVRAARLLGTGRAVTFPPVDGGVIVKVPRDAVDPIDTIVALDLDPKSK